MKKALLPCATLMAFVAISGPARADTSGTDAPVNPYLKTDDEGIPLVVTNPRLAPMTKEEIAARQAEVDKEEADKDWLVRIYAQRMEARAAAHPTDADAALFSELGSNQDLARLAGFEHGLGDTNAAPINVSTVRGISNPADIAPPTASSLARTYDFKSLVPPPSSMSMPGLQNYFGQTTDTPQPKPAEHTPAGTPTTPSPDANNNDLDDIQTPGMVASKNGGTPNLGSPDLTLDLLPGESMEQARLEQANEKALALPVPTTGDELHNPDGSLKADPNATNSVSNPNIPVARPVPEEDAQVPMPVSAAPTITPVHPPLRDPYDILNH